MEECEQRIVAVKEHEKDKPEQEHIGRALQCIQMSYVSDNDDDGPKKNMNIPTKEDHSCKHPITKQVVPCKEA